ncbi:MAG: 16S rRNA (cytosine(967)-C(5))-methyltransferase RsmB [Rhodospirillaceae bacterium]|nr:16S rRNA (cytosine(967)-C(5))-methyltransferase RsmB [Rhodospirillaceae bacterium]
MNNTAPPDHRRIAIEVIDAVLRQRKALDTVLADHRPMAALGDRDRAFARNLIATTLRRLGQIDTVIDSCLERPLPRRAGAVRDILRAGICQLLFTGVADHAAVSTAVELTRAAGETAHVKLVNAILRRVQRDGAGMIAGQDAERLNTPDWLWESWQATYGDETCRRIAAAHMIEAPLDISAIGNPADWLHALQADLLASGTLRRRTGGQVSNLAGFAEGAWWIQDTAARTVAGLLGDVAEKSVIDLCAAPGGKTAYLAAAGARVSAVDRSEPRLRRLRGNLERLHLKAEIIVADGTEWRPQEPADAVLLDAPCSATGTIRRHPDLPWNKTPGDVIKLAAAQMRLLNAAMSMVKPGGHVVFATCSLQPEEGPDQLAQILTETPHVAIDPISAAEVPGATESLANSGTFRSLPCYMESDGGMDGFFACRLVRQ